jgi:hypothetical protein
VNLQWEYRTLHNMDVVKGIADATAAGREGWELVTVVQPTEAVGYMFVLKRQSPDSLGE